MNIGFDVDGVLVDMSGYQMKYGRPYFEKRNIQVSNPRGFDILDIFKCSVDDREKFWIKYIWRYCLFEPMTKGAADLSKKIKANGHKITIVTGRAHTTEQSTTGKLFRWMLKHWLKKNGFVYDEIYYCTESGSAEEKTQICINHGVDVLVDDKPENLISLKDTIRIICYPAIWNEGIKELDSYRVSDMNGVYRVISEMNNK